MCRLKCAMDALDLIDRQKSEIERLQRKILMLYPKGSPCSMQVEVSDNLEREIKSEAIKEFADKLKSEMRLEDDCDYDCENCFYDCNKYVLTIDKLVKEMTEENQ